MRVSNEQRRKTYQGLIAVFFPLNFLEQFFFGLALYAEFGKRNGLQAFLADLDTAFGTHTVRPLMQPHQGFIDRLPAAVAHLHQRDPKLTFKIHQGLVADITRRLQPSLLIFRQRLPQALLDFLDDFLPFAQEHPVEHFLPALSRLPLLGRFLGPNRLSHCDCRGRLCGRHGSRGGGLLLKNGPNWFGFTHGFFLRLRLRRHIGFTRLGTPATGKKFGIYNTASPV